MIPINLLTLEKTLELPPALAGGKYQCIIGFSQKFGIDVR
jgi:hypothetical protein